MKDTGGQMAIFIALIFQILFVFFAMIVNIGLTVHDKINLQNSVDLAAYYAASKQAEILNAIAHVNYQIRQDYKLLAYRLRVIGGIGYEGHPSHLAYRAAVKEEPWTLPVDGNTFYADQPAICIGHEMWKGTGSNENLCRSQLNRIPALPRLPPGPPFIPTYGINLQASEATEAARRAITEKCKLSAVLNWYYAATINLAFKLDVARRRAVISALARAVAEQGFKDLDGLSVKDGTKKTLDKNLTIANRQSQGKFILYNSLSTDVSAETGMPPWLQPIFIEYSIPYVYHAASGSGACTNNVAELMNTAVVPPGVSDPSGNLTGFILNPPTPSSDLFPIRGVEKNPWWMAYVGVYAETAPRKPFAPFGAPVKLTARAFAKPFGGRIGPWETKGWSPNSPSSDRLAPSVDDLAVPRIDRLQRTGDLRLDRKFFPNYSKYPGDKFGLTSTLALAHGREVLNRQFTLDIGDYDLPLSNLLRPETGDGDPIALKPNTQDGGPLRQAELAAIAPDLFDVTYYSVDTNYYYYLNKALIQTSRRLFTPDLGYQKQAQKPFTVSDQIAVAILPFFNTNIPGDPRFYQTQVADHTLTGWTQNTEADYSFPSDKFGRCVSKIEGNSPLNPGNCAVGGRTGYSVKLISLDYINSAGHKLGGENQATSTLLARPTESADLMGPAN